MPAIVARTIGQLAALFIAMLLWTISAIYAASNQAEPVLLDGENPARQLSGLVYALPDPDDAFDRETIRQKFEAGEMPARHQQFLDFGYTTTTQWIVLPIKNTSDISVTYILSTNWPLADGLRAWLLLPGRDDTQIFDKTKESRASEINYSGVAIVSDQFLIPPLSDGLIIARFKPFAFGILPLSLETPLSAFNVARAESIGFAAFYGAMTAAAIIFMLFVIAIRHAGGFYFLGIIIAGLLITACLDGFLFHYVWPDYPLWNRASPFNILALVNISSFALAGYMFHSADRKQLASWSNRLIPASLFPHLVWATAGLYWAIAVGYVFLILSMSALTYAIIIWAQLLQRKRQFAFFFSVLMLIIVATILYKLAIGTGELNIASHNLIKLLYVIMVVSSMIAYATHIAALNRNYTSALKRELDLARNDARMNAELLQSERKFAEAQELVAKHKHRLATTSHDLKQPIASLRLTLDAMAKSGGKQVEANVASAFDYLEDLVNENLQQPPDEADIPSQIEIETVDLDLVFETIRQMFEEEAISKGIRLQVSASGLEVQADIVPLMRIISNLVSNAVKHTVKGAVMLEADRKKDAVRISVADTGPGMSSEEIERFSRYHEKGEQSDGNGLGLGICFDLAKSLGMELAVEATKGDGTRCILIIPDEASSS